MYVLKYLVKSFNVFQFLSVHRSSGLERLPGLHVAQIYAIDIRRHWSVSSLSPASL